MRIRNPLYSFQASVAILRLAARLVPSQKREEWLAEWKSELWHVWQMCHQGAHPSPHDEHEATTFCLGAFKDALWIRQDDSRSTSRRAVQPGPHHAAFSPSPLWRRHFCCWLSLCPAYARSSRHPLTVTPITW